MGLLSGIKKAVKKVFKGIKKVFKKVGKFVGKIASSKWAKGLFLAAAVFTGGLALSAGVQGFAGSSATTFLGKFVAGAKEFVSVLANPIKSAKNLAGGNPLTEGIAAQAGTVAEGASAVQGAAGAAAPVAEAAGTAATELGKGAAAGVQQGAQQAAKKGLLGHAKDIVMSKGGATLIGGALSGMAQGAAQEELLKREDRYRGAFDDESYQSLLSATSNVETPSGYLSRARQVSSRRPTATRGAPGDPRDVYGSYVTPPPGG